MSNDIDAVVIGAGVVGLAAARALALAGYETVVVEADGGVGRGTSSRNSEVIHAGIYYAQGSLKAHACVDGRRRLYAYLNERKLPHKQCGKFIVATEEADIPSLERLSTLAQANGVDDLCWLDAGRAMAIEPELKCIGALHSPSTGILNSHAYMLALQGDFEDVGGVVAFNSRVVSGSLTKSGAKLNIASCGEISTLSAAIVVNAAGIDAPSLLHNIEGFPALFQPKAYYAKGNYFRYAGRSPFSRLIYPSPNHAGLGIHITLDLEGQLRFGPDVEWISAIDYTVDARRSEDFYKEIRKYWPRLPDNSILPDYAGIRPKLVPDGSPAADFRIEGPAEHGVAGWVNLLGIESPGLTSSLTLADMTLRSAEG